MTRHDNVLPIRIVTLAAIAIAVLVFPTSVAWSTGYGPSGDDIFRSGGEDPSPWPHDGDSCIEEFDAPLSPFHSERGMDVGVAISGGPAHDAFGNPIDPRWTIDIQGAPTQAWLYWMGATRAVDFDFGEADLSVTLEALVDGEVVVTREIQGEMVGRRNQLFREEARDGCQGNGGEVVMRAAVPLDMFVDGVTEFRLPRTNCVSCFDEPSIWCREQTYGEPDRGDEQFVSVFQEAFGAAMVVYSQFDQPGLHREFISIDGADYATRGQNSEYRDCDPQQTATEMTCFNFDPAEQTTRGRLTLVVGGLTQQSLPDGGIAGREKTLVTTTDGSSNQYELVQLEMNDLISHSYLGPRLSIYEGALEIEAGDTTACFRVDLLEKDGPESHKQTGVLAHATLSIDRDQPVIEDVTSDEMTTEAQCSLDPGLSSTCGLFQIGPEVLDVKGEAGGVLGSACVAPWGEFKIDNDQFVDGNVRLDPTAYFNQKGSKTWVGDVNEEADLQQEIDAAIALSDEAASRRCTQTFGKLKSTRTITGQDGLNVICVDEIDLKKGKSLTFTGGENTTFIVNVTGKKVKMDRARIDVAGEVTPANLLINVIGTGNTVDIKGGKGGEDCCESVIRGTILAPERKIRLKPGRVEGGLISAEQITLEKGAAFEQHTLTCLE